MCRDKMVEQGLTTEGAEFLLATTYGAQVISVAMGDFSAFDHVVTELMRVRGHVTTTPQPVAADGGHDSRRLPVTTSRRPVANTVPAI